MKKTKFRLVAAAAMVAVAVLLVAAFGARVSSQGSPTAKGTVDGELAPRLAKKLAAAQRFSPGEAGKESLDVAGGWAAQDWLEHSQDGQNNSTPSASAFAGARHDFAVLTGRGSGGGGNWTPLGPTNGLNDLTNTFRNRTVYTAGTENFAGRTAHGVIAPTCTAARCTLYIAATNGGIWKTDNALATQPSWDFISQTFEQQNTSSLELDPNKADTLWAGTGEPNACGSGCEVGVGVYVSKNGGKNWTGPLGADVFSGRGVGSIQVKPGDSNTIFVATARATRGISNTCCGGTDALIPGAAHFGVYRSTNGGSTWELVNQGAASLCTASTPDQVSLNQTPCSPRGARRIHFDPVEPNTVYASFFARGIWRSKQNGDVGTWEQIMAPRGFVGLGGPTTERDEFDVVSLPSGETRMYVGAGGGNYAGTGANAARLRVNDAVRNVAAGTVQTTWVDKQQYSFAFCEPQCSYDNYVYAPANPENAPNSGATVDTVYLSGSNQYNENNHSTGRSNGRAVLLSTDAGTTFTDMTEDDRSSVYPGALHPDHHALVVNPANWQQFFDLSDGGVNRSDGAFVNDTGDCTTAPHNFSIAANLAFCQVVLSRVPNRLNAINLGLRTLAMYTMDYSRNNPGRLSAGTQDNGSWETTGSHDDWLQVSVADGGPNRFDATGADPNWAMTAYQNGSLSVRYDPMTAYDVNWISDTIGDPTSNPPYVLEAVAFAAPAISDPVHAGWLFTGREHVFRSTNYGRNPVLATKAAHRANCNVWNGAFGDLNGNGVYDLPGDACDDWKALGDPGPDGRLTAAVYGDRPGGFVSVDQRAPGDAGTLWAATGSGRIFVSKNADAANPADVVFDRIDNDVIPSVAPPRYPTDIYVDPTNPNHAWITYSGYNAKTPTTPGHVFEVTYAAGASTFVNLDGQNNNGYGDIPANTVVHTPTGTLYVGTDYGVVIRELDSDVWHAAPPGLPAVDVPDLQYDAQNDVLYAGTHGQGAWQLKTH